VSIDDEERSSGRATIPKLPVLPIVGVALSTPALVWAAQIGKRLPPRPDEGPMFGPYAVDIRLEYAVGALAAVVAVIGLAALIRASIKRTFDRQGWIVVAFAVAAGYLAAISWRTETSGVDPAVRINIGGGAIVEAWPIAVSALVAGAVAVSSKRREQPRVRPAALMVAAVLLAPFLIGIQYALRD
jgi:general stress protein CsbA